MKGDKFDICFIWLNLNFSFTLSGSTTGLQGTRTGSKRAKHPRIVNENGDDVAWPTGRPWLWDLCERWQGFRWVINEVNSICLGLIRYKQCACEWTHTIYIVTTQSFIKLHTIADMRLIATFGNIGHLWYILYQWKRTNPYKIPLL